MGKSPKGGKKIEIVTNVKMGKKIDYCETCEKW